MTTNNQGNISSRISNTISRRFAPVLSALVLATGAIIITTGAWADSGANHRATLARPIPLGVSGGSIDDHDGAYCCSGTLGGLVTDGAGNAYILSNNHVLGRVNRATPGEDTLQPGLIDSRCSGSTADAVADFSEYIPISFTGNNLVDAALARVRPDQVDPTGAVLDIGTPATSTTDPYIGMPVQKSGRTTGLTTGQVADIGVTVVVGYPKKCGSRGGPGAVMDDQMLITPASFSDSGDSGSFIFENGSSPRAVGLLFAGSSTSTIANRMSNVLAASWSVGPLAMAGGAVAGCTGNGDCVDTDACTIDTCLANGACQHAPMVCDDGSACTIDSCSAGSCVFDPITCDDGDACTADGCDAASGCTATPISGCTNPCGDGTCDISAGEDCTNCAADCAGKTKGKPSTRFCCGGDVDCSDARCTSGSTCVQGAVSGAGGHGRASVAQALAVKRRNSARLLAMPDVVGHGVGRAKDGGAVISVYLARGDSPSRARIPKEIEGVPVRVHVTGPFTTR